MLPHLSMFPAFVIHVWFGLGVTVFALVLRRGPLRWGGALRIFGATAVLSGLVGLATAPPSAGFGLLLALSWTLAVVLPLSAFAIALRGRGALRTAFASIGIVGVLLSLEAFVWEPQALEINVHEIHDDRIQAPLRIAVIADLQTDAIGAHERAALEAVRDAQPDLVLFAGDVIQLENPDAYARGWHDLATLLHEVDLQAPLGLWMVGGDSESVHPNWRVHARRAGLLLVPEGVHSWVPRDDVRITGLDVIASTTTTLHVPRHDDRLHVTFGHRPDFALGSIDADVLLAGHTHGGQVQLPGFGPLLTLSSVPRSWAAGRTTLPSGATLIVSRGIGMERSVAPRIRFWCPPEVVIVDIQP